MGDRSFKVSLIGDGTVGKTCLWTVQTTNSFPVDYVPNVLDQCTSIVNLNGVTFKINIWDTAGQEDYDSLRLLTYPNTDAFVVCYAINNRHSFENLLTRWIPELSENYPKVPLILVGTKCDTRRDPNIDAVTRTEGKKMSKKIGAAYFVECSALEKTNVNVVFEEAVRAVVGHRKLTYCVFL